ncbi:MAG: tetratricopeptide repeat protein [Candidatus Aminicenantes bacterium]|nr:tetratricopeptide repeat protein [Candidatus Aminicenantes bacterium]
MRQIVCILTIIVLLSFCSGKNNKAELDFANAMAKQGLWKEAYMRWQRVAVSGKDNASLHNNMAIALESMGKTDEAEKEYQKALEMDPKNPRIKANYDSLKTFLGKGDEIDQKVDKEKKDEKGEI